MMNLLSYIFAIIWIPFLSGCNSKEIKDVEHVIADGIILVGDVIESNKKPNNIQ